MIISALLFLRFHAFTVWACMYLKTINGSYSVVLKILFFDRIT